MENIIKAVKDYLDKMSPEEIDAMLVELGNDKASAGPMFMSREDFKKKSVKNDKYHIVSVKDNIDKEHNECKKIPAISARICFPNVVSSKILEFEISSNICEMIS